MKGAPAQRRRLSRAHALPLLLGGGHKLITAAIFARACPSPRGRADQRLVARGVEAWRRGGIEQSSPARSCTAPPLSPLPLCPSQPPVLALPSHMRLACTNVALASNNERAAPPLDEPSPPPRLQGRTGSNSPSEHPPTCPPAPAPARPAWCPCLKHRQQLLCFQSPALVGVDEGEDLARLKGVSGAGRTDVEVGKRRAAAVGGQPDAVTTTCRVQPASHPGRVGQGGACLANGAQRDVHRLVAAPADQPSHHALSRVRRQAGQQVAVVAAGVVDAAMTERWVSSRLPGCGCLWTSCRQCRRAPRDRGTGTIGRCQWRLGGALGSVLLLEKTPLWLQTAVKLPESGPGA